MSMIDDRLWDVAAGGAFNYDGAIYKLGAATAKRANIWVCRVTPEIDVADGQVQQGFSSGVIIARGFSVNGARIVKRPAALWAPTKPGKPEPWSGTASALAEFHVRPRRARCASERADWTCSPARAWRWCKTRAGIADAPDGGKWNEWDGVNELRRLCGYPCRSHRVRAGAVQWSGPGECSTTRTASRAASGRRLARPGVSV